MARFRYGNSSASAIIRSAASANTKVQTLQDTEAKFSWDYGPQDAAALKTYQSYANGRMSALQKLGDAASLDKAITFQKDIFTAQKSYGSTQLRGTAINVMEGGASQQDKVNQLRDLYGQAVQLGDQPLSMELHQQYDTAVKTMLDQQAANAKAAAASSKQAQADNYSNLQDQLQEMDKPMMDALQTFQSNGGQDTSGGRLYAGLATYMQQRQQYLEQAANSGLLSASNAHKVQVEADQLKAGTYAIKAIDPITGTATDIKLGDRSLTVNDLNRAAELRTKYGVDPFHFVPDSSGTGGKLEYKPIVGTQRVIDPTDGQAKMVPIYSLSGADKGAYNKALTTLKSKYANVQGSAEKGTITVATDSGTHTFYVNPDGSAVSVDGQIDPRGYVTGMVRANTNGSIAPVSPEEFKGDLQDYQKQLQQGKQGQPKGGATETGQAIAALSNPSQGQPKGTNPHTAMDMGQTIGSDIMGIGNTMRNVGGGVGGFLSSAANLVTGVNATRAAQAKAQQAAMQAAQQKMVQQAQAQIAQVKATPLSQPLPANMGAAARYVGQPLPDSFLKTAPVFTGPNLTSAQQTQNALSAINNSTGFFPKL